MEVSKIKSENFEENVLKADMPVLVDFYADWCGPCKMMAPIMDEIAKEVDGKVRVYKLNIDEDSEIAVKYEVMSIPTIILFKEGNVEKTWVGVRDKNEILKGLQ